MEEIIQCIVWRGVEAIRINMGVRMAVLSEWSCESLGSEVDKEAARQ